MPPSTKKKPAPAPRTITAFKLTATDLARIDAILAAHPHLQTKADAVRFALYAAPLEPARRG